MKTIKRLLASLVAGAMMMSTVAFAGTYADVKDDASYAEAVSVLSDLAIIKGDDKGNFSPDKTITRAEFATIVCKAMGLGSAADGAKGATQFKDVAADHWGSGFINLAAQMGIIKGYGDDKFGPEDEVTYEQAIKMIVASLGYEPKAAYLGGYPTGYLAIAAQEGITKGATGKAGEKAKRSIVAMLTYNALDVPLMEQTGFGKDVTYEVQNGKNDSDYKTLLTEKLDVAKVEAIVTDNRLKSDVGAKDKKVDLAIKEVNEGDDADYYDNNGYLKNATDSPKIGNTKAKDYMGYKVVAYVRDLNGSDSEIIAISPKSGDNNVLTIQRDDFDTINLTTTTAQVKYWKNKDRDTEVTDVDLNTVTTTSGTSTSVVYVLNGVKQSSSLTRPANGQVTFIDNNDDDKYDYAMVTEYEYCVVDEVSSKGTVTDKVAAKSFKFDKDDEDLEFAIYLDGKQIQPSELKEFDVLTVVTAKDSSGTDIRYDAYVTRTPVKGVVAEKSSETITFAGNNETVSIFKVGDKNFKRASNDVKSFDIEDEGTFYISMDGKVAHYEKGDVTSAAPENYGWLFNVAKTTGIDNVIEMKLFTAKGEWVVYKTATKFDYNTNGLEDQEFDTANLTDTVSTNNTISGLFNLNTGAATPVTRQLVTYKLDSAGKIKEISFNAAANNDDYISLDKSYPSTDKASYTLSKKKLGSYYLTDATVIFNIDGVESDEDSYSIVKATAFEDDENYTVNMYDIDSNDIGVIVGYAISGGIVDDSAFALIKSVSNMNNADGDSVKKLSVYQDGQFVDITTKKDVDFYKYWLDTRTSSTVNNDVYSDVYTGFTQSDLSEGQIIQYSKNAKGEVDKIRVVYSKDNVVVNTFDFGKEYVDSANTDIVISLGYTANKGDGRLYLGAWNELYVENNTSYPTFELSGAKYAEYNYATDKVLSNVDSGDIDEQTVKTVSGVKTVDVNGSLVIVREFENNTKDIITLSN